MSHTSQYLDSQMDRFPQLSHARTVELIRRAQSGDKASKDLVVNSNLRLVVYHADRYKTFPGFELDEFVDEGVIGLMRAVDKFDPDAGYQFSTFASNGIKKAFNRFLENNRYTIRLPVHSTNRLYKIRKAEKELHNPTLDQIAEVVDLSINEVEFLIEAEKLVQGVDSLDRPVGEEEITTLSELIPDSKTNVFEEVATKMEAEQLRDAMNTILPTYWQEILEMTYFEEMKNSEVADFFGLATPSNVWKRNSKSLELLYRWYHDEVTLDEIEEIKKRSNATLETKKMWFKTCNACDIKKNGAHFSIRMKNGKITLQPYCKECKSEIDKKYSAAKVAKKQARRENDSNYQW